MADIQLFKNERLVGERHDGLLVILKKPEGEYGDYVRVTIEEENADRMQLMKSLADSEKTSLPESTEQTGGTLAQPILQRRMDRNASERRFLAMGAKTGVGRLCVD